MNSISRGILDPEQAQELKQKMTAAAYAPGGVNWQKLFSYYDRDCSGSLYFEEFRKLIRKDAKITETTISNRRLECLFKSLDVDNCGCVDFVDLVLWLDPAKQSPISSPVARRKAEKDRQASECVFNSFAASLKSNRAAKRAGKLPKETDSGISFLSFWETVGNPGSAVRARAQRWLLEQGARTPEELVKFGFQNEFLTTLPLGYDERQSAIDFLSPVSDSGLPNSMDCVNLLMWISFCELDVLHRKRLQKPSKQKSKKQFMQTRIQLATAAAIQGVSLCDWADLFCSYDPFDKGTINCRNFSSLIRKEAAISSEVISEVALESLFKSFDTDNSGTMAYRDFLAWLELPEADQVDRERNTGGEKDQLEARRAEAAKRVRASLGALVDLAKTLEKRTGVARQRTLEATQRGMAARALIEHRSHAMQQGASPALRAADTILADLTPAEHQESSQLLLGAEGLVNLCGGFLDSNTCSSIGSFGE